MFSVLAETLRLQFPQIYMMSLGLSPILCVLYLPGGLAFTGWWQDSRQWRARWARKEAQECLKFEARDITVRFGGRRRWTR